MPGGVWPVEWSAWLGAGGIVSVSASECACDVGTGAGVLHCLWLDDLGAEAAVAFDGRFADHLCDLVDFLLFGCQLLFQFVELSFNGFVFLQGLLVELRAFL